MTSSCTCYLCVESHAKKVAALVLKALGNRTSGEVNNLYSATYTTNCIPVESAGDKLRREAMACDAEDELIEWAREFK